MKAKWLIAAALLITIAACKKDPNSNNNDTPDKYPNCILITTYGSKDSIAKLLILNDTGGTIKEKITEQQAVNFQKWRVNGKTRFTYFVQENSYRIPFFFATVLGYEVIADEDLNEIKRVYLKSHGNITTDVHKLLDCHDFIYISDDHYISMAYYVKTVTNIPASLNPAAGGTKVISAVIQEVKNDQVIWQWDGTDYPELYETSVEGNKYSVKDTAQDYLHINSMTIDPNDDNLVCSFRNADLVVKIDRHTGAIIWRLGGKKSDFPMTDDQKFLRQHHATVLPDKSILLFDNGDATIRPSTRILEFKIDQSAKTITDFKAFYVPARFSQFMGSVQKFDGTYFIGGGTGKYIMEANINTHDRVFYKELPENTYRAFRYK